MNTVNTKPYHHGNLREELVRIGVELAADGGPDAVVLREAARRAGVSPAAAYRHFAGQDGLRGAVRDSAVAALGCSMSAAIAAAPSGDAGARLLAAGRGYVDFATAQPLLFRCLASGFGPHLGTADAPPGAASSSDRDGDPFSVLLREAEVFLTRADGPPSADGLLEVAVALWSSAHGISVLSTSGALAGVPVERRGVLVETTLAAAIRGIEPRQDAIAST